MESETSGAPPRQTPDINLCRDPRWGRCLEVPGEDPFLSGEYAMRYVQALQAADAQGFALAAANVKHVFFYDVEAGVAGGENYNRMSFNAVLTEQVCWRWRRDGASTHP